MPPITSKPRDPQPASSMMPFFPHRNSDCMGSSCRSSYRSPRENLCSELRRNIRLGVGVTALGGVGTLLFGREVVQAQQNNSPSSLHLSIGAAVGVVATGLGGVATLLSIQTYRMTMAAVCENDRAVKAWVAQLGRDEIPPPVEEVPPSTPMERATLNLSMAGHTDDTRPERLHPDDPPVNPALVDPKTLPKVTHGGGNWLPEPETIGFPNRRLPRPVVEGAGSPAPGGDTIGVIHDEFSRALAMDMTDGVVTWSKLPGRVAVLTGATITHGDGRKTRIVPDAQPSPELDAGINGWLDGNGDMSDVGKVATMFGTPTHCPGAAVLMWGCTPQRYTPRVYTFSTDVDEIQRQQLMIGACLVAPAVAAKAGLAGIAVGVREGIATLIQWAQPVAAAF